MSRWSLASVAWALLAPPGGQGAGHPPGGYWRPGERPAPAPPDGRWEIAAGAAMTSLGILGVGAAAAGVYVAAPERCQADTGWPEATCRNVYALSWARVAYSTFLTVGGVVLLGVGIHRRRVRRAFDARRLSAWAAPRGRGGWELGLVFRFGLR